MRERPETRYAWIGDHAAIAYQIVGDGPVDLVYLQGWASNVDLNWEWPPIARFLDGLAGLSRLIVMDPRGVGLSERFAPPHLPPIESLMDDVNAVLDAAGSERAIVFATEEYGFTAIPFAATYPDRCIGLILWAAAPTWWRDDEITWAWGEGEWTKQAESIRSGYGTIEAAQRELAVVLPSLAADPGAAARWARLERATCTPATVLAGIEKYRDTDVRAVLPAVHTPTLILHAADDEIESVESARYLAAHILNARLEVLPGKEHYPFGSLRSATLQAIGKFLADVGETEAAFDRILATVLFSDIVGSTERASALGDANWKMLLERHRASVRAHVARFRGVEVDSVGDGFFASFDGPARAVRCAQAIVADARASGIEVRVGLHTGECEMIDGKVGGIAVTIGARIGARAQPSEVLVSSTVKDLVAGAGLEFEDRGEHELKGVPDRWRLYAVIR